MKFYIMQCNPTIGAFCENEARIISGIEEAKRQGCELVVTSEMAIPGYFPDDLLFEPGFCAACDQALQHILPHTKGITLVVGTVRLNEARPGKPCRNTAAVIIDGALVGFQDKWLLPTYDVFDEARYMEPGSEQQVWQLAGKRVGITICEDIWPTKDPMCAALYPEDPIAYFEGKQLDLLINISASPYAKGKPKVRSMLAQQLVKRIGCPVVLVNQVGAQDSLIYDGSSCFVSAEGDCLLQAPSFREYAACCSIGQKVVPHTPLEPVEELFNALVLGVRDYFRKQGFIKACLGLSGGIDSSVVAAIASEALGRENMLGVLLPSRFTSAASSEDAQLLAKNLGIATKEFSIETCFKAYAETLLPIKLRELTEENLQARIRGMLLMAISNQEGFLVLNTGNKSELAMGYTTLYGDSCGSLAVIGDVLKNEVYALARWINRERGVIPERVITRAPTAELRPNQKDSDTLPEYAVLDPIVEQLVVEKKSVEEVSASVGVAKELVEHVAKTIDLNEYKRRQSPLSLRVSQKAFSCGRRVPIVHSFVRK